MKNNQALADAVGQILLPTEKYAQLRNGKRVVKEKLFLPGYVLVEARLDGEIAHTLRFIPNVLGFLSDGKASTKPAPVSQTEINKIVGSVEDSAANVTLEETYVIGEKVKVTNGAFSGFNGVVSEIMQDKHKLKVIVTIFDRQTPLELGFNDVEKE